MRIWKMSCDIDNDEIAPENEKDNEIFEKAYKGKLLGKGSWTPIDMYTSKEGVTSDIVSREGDLIPLILNKKAVDTLDDLIEGQVEILPLKHPSENYYAINVINVLDCIDYENAEPNDWGGFDNWAFIEEIIENQHIF